MKIAMAQINPTIGDIIGNRDLILRNLEKIKESDAAIAVFP
jgi:predicted amidohydrolase